MADDALTQGGPAEPLPPEDGRAKRMRNLVPPCKPGETRNRAGVNGRDKNKIIVDFLEAVDKKDPEGRKRIICLLESMYLRARTGNGVAMKFLGEQYAGKAKQSIDLSNDDGSLRTSPLSSEEMIRHVEALQASLKASETPTDDGAGTQDPA